jgi:group I intron endonuclease
MTTIEYCIDRSIFSGIYKLVSDDGKFYLGSSKRLFKRYQRHHNDLRNKNHDNPKIQNKYNKGLSKWKFELVEECEVDNLIDQEQKYLDIHFSDKLCLNCNSIADKPPSMKGLFHTQTTKDHIRNVRIGNSTVTDDGRERISAAHKGIPLSDDHKKKLSLSKKGKPKSEEHKRKISEYWTGRPRPYRQGISISEEQKKMISDTLKGRKVPKTTLQKRNISRYIKGLDKVLKISKEDLTILVETNQLPKDQIEFIRNLL